LDIERSLGGRGFSIFLTFLLKINRSGPFEASFRNLFEPETTEIVFINFEPYLTLKPNWN